MCVCVCVLRPVISTRFMKITFELRRSSSNIESHVDPGEHYNYSNIVGPRINPFFNLVINQSRILCRALRGQLRRVIL